MAFVKALFALVVALIAGQAAAFTVAPTTGRPLARPIKSVSTLKAGYVPDGLTAEQYAAIQKKEQAEKKANKDKRAKQKSEDLDTWMKKRDAKFPNSVGKGHTFAKVVDKEKSKPAASKFLDALKK